MRNYNYNVNFTTAGTAQLSATWMIYSFISDNEADLEAWADSGDWASIRGRLQEEMWAIITSNPSLAATIQGLLNLSNFALNNTLYSGGFAVFGLVLVNTPVSPS